MSTTTMVHVRVDNETKAQATEALSAMGLSVSDAVRIFLKRVVAEQAMPIELKVPNAETRAAMEESRAIVRAHRARFATAQELFDDLEKNSKSYAPLTASRIRVYKKTHQGLGATVSVQSLRYEKTQGSDADTTDQQRRSARPGVV